MIILATLTGILYCLSLLLIFIFSIGQLHLTWNYLKSKKSKPEDLSKGEFSMVTIQLPVYNEKYVIKRLLKAVSLLDYPTDKLEIQVLDDSDDESVFIINEEVKKLQADGVNISVLRREERTGYKAGALAYGLSKAKGEYIAIFDADFLPRPGFLRKALGLFSKENIGMVQTRWGHINRDYSILTKLQAFGLDAHFTVEQSGRSHAGSFINFNGTGGIWRKECIINAGGWSADTLTEDLDLSYRAQLKGWKFKYLEDHESPAELPVIMPAVKSQQYRWNKGAAETARKHIKAVLQSKITAGNKIHAVFHLFNSSVFICILAAALLSVPVLMFSFVYPSVDIFFKVGVLFLLGFFSIAFFYFVATQKIHGKAVFANYLVLFPSFLVVSMGLSLHNTIAVLEGLTGRKSAFIRTPKFNILAKGDSWAKNKYLKLKIDFTTIGEGILAIYFILAVVLGLMYNMQVLVIFHLMLAIGFSFVFFYSVKALVDVRKG